MFLFVIFIVYIVVTCLFMFVCYLKQIAVQLALRDLPEASAIVDVPRNLAMRKTAQYRASAG